MLTLLHSNGMTDGPFLDNVIVLSPFIIVQSFCGYLISLNLVDRFPPKAPGFHNFYSPRSPEVIVPLDTVFKFEKIKRASHA